MTKREQEIAQARQFAEQYLKLERRSCTLVEWISLKFSCSRTKAENICERAGLFDRVGPS